MGVDRERRATDQPGRPDRSRITPTATTGAKLELRGTFAGSNPAIAAGVEAVGKDPYNAGWLYEADGEPDEKCVPLDQYRALLDATIDKILEKQKADTE